MWSPLRFFSGQDDTSQEKVALVVLNGSLNGLEELLSNLWSRFSVHACADGGSNLLFDAFPTERERFIPSFIAGDLDSVRKDVLEYYLSKGSDVVRMSCQDSTDFDKVLKHLIQLQGDQKIELQSVYALNGMWGRFDSTLSNVHTLFTAAPGLGDTRLHLLSEDSLVCLLTPGYHEILVDSGLEEGHCGLVPLGEPCQTCTTTGLQWNLHGESMQFGGMISTNNLIEEGTRSVTVKNSHTLLWTMSHKLVR